MAGAGVHAHVKPDGGDWQKEEEGGTLRPVVCPDAMRQHDPGGAPTGAKQNVRVPQHCLRWRPQGNWSLPHRLVVRRFLASATPGKRLVRPIPKRIEPVSFNALARLMVASLTASSKSCL